MFLPKSPRLRAVYGWGKKEEARSREAALIQAILAQVRRSYGEPVEDDDDDTMSSDDQ